MASALARRFAALLTIAVGMTVAWRAHADDPATIGGRIVTSYTGGDSSDPAVVSLQKSVVSNATSLLPKLGANGSFSDVDYTGAPAADWGVGTHFTRLLTLAQAYQAPGGSLYHSASLLTSIENALSYGTGPSYYCGAASCVSGNWWWWQIGVPQALGPTLILMQGAIPSTTIASLTSKLAYHVGDDAAMTAETGENELWVALGHLYVAVLQDSTTDAAAVQGAVLSTAAVNSKAMGDGIKPDQSFQFHTGQLYTGGYGADYSIDIMTYLGLTSGTAFALPAAVVSQAVDYLANGVAWSIYDARFDPAVCGREITRPGSGNANAQLEAFVPAALLSSPIQTEMQSLAKELVTEVGTGGLSVVTEAEQIKAMSVTGAFPSGHRHYPSSDYTVHRRGDSFLSIKMLSTRTRSGELVNGEGLQGARQSDGKMFLVLQGDEYLGASGQGLWPAVDWSRLPGITVVQDGTAASTDYGVGTESFVGGTGDGQNGVSAMVLAPIGSTLHGSKSWFFFDGYAVFLANHVAATAASPVETIVEQWPLSAPTVPVVADGTTVATGPYSATLPNARWISADGLGYFFPGGSSVDVEVKDQTGDWSSLGVSSGSVTARFLTVALEHGTAPTNASAAYAIAFGGQDMSTFAQAPPFTIVQNDATVSAVSGQGSAGAVFWAPGSIALNGATVASDTPAVVWLASDGTTMTISAADPAQGTGAIQLTVSGSFKSGSGSDSGVTATVTAVGATVSIDRTGGVTHTATLLFTEPSAPDGGPLSGADGGTPGQPGPPGTADASLGDTQTASADPGGGCGCRVAGEASRDPGRPGSLAVESFSGAVGCLALLWALRRRRLVDPISRRH